MNGAFITVEGADGSGKTTHIDFIQGCLSDHGVQVVRTREPGGTALGELLRGILLGNEDASISDRAELMLVFAARTQHLDEVITPALESGKWVLCDRFTDATYAYQGGGRGIDHDAIETLEQWVQGKLQPDLTVLLDVPVEVGLARTRQRGDHPGLPRDARDQMVISLRRSGTHDRFERQALEFKQAVRRVYLERAARFESRIKLVDANKTIEQVRTDLKAVLETFWQQHKIAGNRR